VCSAAQGEEACFECCDAKNPGGMEVFEDAWLACACQASVCATQCGQSMCADNPIDPVDGDACSTCLEAATQCDTQAEAACEANPACGAGFQCAADSKCSPELAEDGDDD
jgi:hypothetical protein